jgi:hypothetical protein
MAQKQKKGIGCGGVVVLGVLALFAYAATRKPNPGTNHSTNQSTPTPTSTAAVAPAAPNAIPGLAAVDMYGNLTNKGFKLQTAYGDRSTGTSWTCKSTESGCDLTADCYGETPTAIQNIRGIVENTNQGDPIPVAKEFLGYLATLPYDGSDPAKAKKWVEDHVGEVTETVIGGVRFELKGSRFVRMLIMTRAK